MTTLNPFSGANSEAYFVKELVRGVTPDNPVFTPFETTGGMPQLQMDAILSEIIGSGREITDVDLGNVNVSGTMASELAYGKHDELIAASQGSDWVAGSTLAAMDITVDPVAFTYTRATGDFVADGVVVGDFIRFPALTGQNAVARFVTAITPTVVTVEEAKEHKPLTVEALNTTAVIGDSCPVGNEAPTFTVLIKFTSKDAVNTMWVRTTGVEIGGWTLNADQNAKVTVEFPFVGYDQHVEATAPAGATFGTPNEFIPYSNIASSLSKDGVSQGAFTSFGYSSDNAISAMFTLGCELSAFVEREKITNTLTGSAFVENSELLLAYRQREAIHTSFVLNNNSGGAIGFVMPRAMLSEVTPERSSTSLVTSVGGTAMGNATQSSLTIYRMPI